MPRRPEGIVSYVPMPRLLAALLALGVSAAGCSESHVFIPLEPSQQSARLRQALDDLYARFQFPTATLNAGRRGAETSFVIYQDETLNGLYVVDWSSANNNITVAVHRTGSAGVLDGPLERDNCSTPARLFSGGSPINAPTPTPLCPIVASDTSNAKPKFIAMETLPPGQYDVVLTNPGPGNETIRAAFFEN